MDDVRCFLVEPTGTTERSLRRFTRRREAVCPGGENGGGHEALVRIENGRCRLVDDGEWITWQGDREPDLGDHWPHDDPRWPPTCASCGYRFLEGDSWQLFWEPLYAVCPHDADQAPQPGLWTRRTLPPGAMYWAPWEAPDERGPEGLGGLVVTLPDGSPWNIDGAAWRSGEQRVPRAWTRTGTPPLVTARPSILTPTYHGWLTDGVLSHC